MKIIRMLEELVRKVLLFLSLLILLAGCYVSYDLYQVYVRTETESLQKYKPDQGETFAAEELSKDCIGWLTIEGTNIDYPVMQGKDNLEYLNKDPYGEYSLSGSIFLDVRCEKDFSSEYSLLYGHHMEYGAMFGALDDFSDKEYFDEHRRGTLTVGEKTYEITLFAFVETDTMDTGIFDPSENGGPMVSIREKAKIFCEPDEGKILCMSTCKTPYSIRRTCVFGILREGEDE